MRPSRTRATALPDGREATVGVRDGARKQEHDKGGEDVGGVTGAIVQLVIGVVAGVLMFLALYGLGLLP